LANFPIFRSYSRSEILRICQGGEIVVLNHREPLFESQNEAKHFGVVLSGAFKLLRISPLGDPSIVHFSCPGDVIGGLIMANHHPVYPISAISMGASRFLRMPRETFLNQWCENNELLMKVQNVAASRVQVMQNKISLMKAPLSFKIAVLLLDLAEKTPHSMELELPMPITRAEIAESVGSTVESVIRILTQWSKQNIIQSKDSRIRILKPATLVDPLNHEK